MVDDVTLECLAAVTDTSISSKRVARALKRLGAVHGKLGTIVSNNGTEMTSCTVLKYCGKAGNK
jgi:putative transposase